MNFLQQRLQSIRYAINGLAFMLRTQQNAWVHLAITILVVALAFWLGLTRYEWLWILLALAMVWFAEAVNTGFEHLCDVVSPEFSKNVEKAKDVAAGAVLVAVIFAIIVGVIVLGPHVLARFGT